MRSLTTLACVALVAAGAAVSVGRAGDETPSFPRSVLVELFTSQG